MNESERSHNILWYNSTHQASLVVWVLLEELASSRQIVGLDDVRVTHSPRGGGEGELLIVGQDGTTVPFGSVR